MQEDIKRLFFGIEVHAPWPSHFPKGRMLDETHRHLTLAFLGNVPYQPLNDLLKHFPKITLKIGSSGYFDECLPLPPRHSNVIAWHSKWLDQDQNAPIPGLQKMIVDWLTAHGYTLDQRDWLPHATLCRQPFNAREWCDEFLPLPFYTGAIHLYESSGNLNYIPLWSFPVHAPFEEINHTADMAFIIRGENLLQLYHNAFTALAFKAPEFLDFFVPQKTFNHLDEIIITLNQIVSKADTEVGSPLKAVSFHGQISQVEDSLLQWEMIVDV